MQDNNCCSYIYTYEKMKMNAVSYMIKYVPCLQLTFKLQYIETYFWQNVEKCPAF